MITEAGFNIITIVYSDNMETMRSSNIANKKAEIDKTLSDLFEEAQTRGEVLSLQIGFVPPSLFEAYPTQKER